MKTTKARLDAETGERTSVSPSHDELIEKILSEGPEWPVLQKWADALKALDEASESPGPAEIALALQVTNATFKELERGVLETIICFFRKHVSIKTVVKFQLDSSSELMKVYKRIEKCLG